MKTKDGYPAVPYSAICVSLEKLGYSMVNGNSADYIFEFAHENNAIKNVTITLEPLIDGNFGMREQLFTDFISVTFGGNNNSGDAIVSVIRPKDQ